MLCTNYLHTCGFRPPLLPPNTPRTCTLYTCVPNSRQRSGGFWLGGVTAASAAVCLGFGWQCVNGWQECANTNVQAYIYIYIYMFIYIHAHVYIHIHVCVRPATTIPINNSPNDPPLPPPILYINADRKIKTNPLYLPPPSISSLMI
jgi:hypothetical protein